MHISLTLTFVYYKFKSDISKLMSLQISPFKERNYSFYYFLKHSLHCIRFLTENIHNNEACILQSVKFLWDGHFEKFGNAQFGFSVKQGVWLAISTKTKFARQLLVWTFHPTLNVFEVRSVVFEMIYTAEWTGNLSIMGSFYKLNANNTKSCLLFLSKTEFNTHAQWSIATEQIKTSYCNSRN
jgi:hypothetical protein